MKKFDFYTLKRKPGPKFQHQLMVSKTYGLCVRDGKTYYRNYKRVLKNGKGLSYLEAVWETEYANFSEEFKPLFWDLGKGNKCVVRREK